jgi:hypothetical protein
LRIVQTKATASRAARTAKKNRALAVDGSLSSVLDGLLALTLISAGAAKATNLSGFANSVEWLFGRTSHKVSHGVCATEVALGAAVISTPLAGAALAMIWTLMTTAYLAALLVVTRQSRCSCFSRASGLSEDPRRPIPRVVMPALYALRNGALLCIASVLVARHYSRTTWPLAAGAGILVPMIVIGTALSRSIRRLKGQLVEGPDPVTVADIRRRWRRRLGPVRIVPGPSRIVAK